jgi:hypothetical protein
MKHAAAQAPSSHESHLLGNRWVLVGGIVYLLEWVAIIWAGVAGVDAVVTRGTTVEDLSSTYAGNVDAVSSMAGWFAVVLLGRILVFVGLRRALVDSGHGNALLDLAVLAAAVSVTLEIASYGLSTAAAELAADGDRAGMVLLDRAGVGLNLMIGGGLGVAIVCTAYCMWRSRLFSPALNVVGLLSGVAIVGAQLTVAPAQQTLFDILYFFPLVFWVWMLWAGVVLWRRTPRRADRPEVSMA